MNGIRNNRTQNIIKETKTTKERKEQKEKVNIIAFTL